MYLQDDVTYHANRYVGISFKSYPGHTVKETHTNAEKQNIPNKPYPQNHIVTLRVTKPYTRQAMAFLVPRVTLFVM